ncbi:MAG: PRC-barrel domain-containing protein [Firmicutes bacterium]|nr:PRC-barrel domain-containing protein [Bacillota bacterium]
MKKTREILELPVVGVEEGRELGRVKDLVVHAEGGRVAYLLVAGDEWYRGAVALAFEDVLGLGEDAVTTEGAGKLQRLAEAPGLEELLAGRVRVIGARVLSRKGKLAGRVAEYFVDEESGRIAGIELQAADHEEPVFVPAEQILTFGREVLVVREQKEVAGPEGARTGGGQASELTEVFAEKQRKYLLGKRAGQTVTANGEIIVAAGGVITEEVVARAQAAGKLLELSLSVEV